VETQTIYSSYFSLFTSHFLWLLLLRVRDYKLEVKDKEIKMAKDVINVDGEDVVVREDTAKSYRGTIWALLSVGAFVAIAAFIFFWFFLRSATDDKPIQTPAQIENRRQ